MEIIFSPRCLEFGNPGHPESPERVRKAAEFLRNRDYEFVEPEPCSEEDLLQVHSRELVDKVKNGKFFSMDSPAYGNIYEYARLSVGGAIKAAETNSFSLMRPPGHHAGVDSLGGFCYFNNLAVAVEKLNKRTLIADFDRHHGNGTQEIFEGNDKVEYVSLHGGGYPGTGVEPTKNCRNHLFREPPGDEKYLEVLDDLLQIDKNFDLLAISAGFDGYREDPLGLLGLSMDCYRKIGERLSELDLPVFCVLEGGYVADKLGELIHVFLQALKG